MTQPKALYGVRIVAIAEGPAVGLACMVLADFGAEVVRIEPPGGDPWRGHPASRLTFRGQASVVWDREDSESTARLRDFIRDTADAVIVQDDRVELAGARPDLIVCEVSAFGAGSGFEGLPLAEPLVAARLGRMAAFQGLVARDGPVYSALQVATHATGQAIASAVLAGLVRKTHAGVGTRFAASLARGLLPYEMGGLFGLERAALAGTAPVAIDPHRIMPTINYHPVQCADGRWLQLGNLLPHLLERFLQLTGLDADVPPELAGKAPAEWPAAALEAFRDTMLERMRTRSVDEWMAIFVADGGVVAHPYQTTREALDDPDIVGNGHVVAHGDVRSLGCVARLERTPGAVSFEVPAPGAHTLAAFAPRGPIEHRPVAPSAAPLAGITVVEFATIIAAPLGVSCLADLGARVIKVEPLGGDPFRGMLNGYGAARVNAGKESIALDLKHPDGRRIAHALIARADVLVHNYRPGVPEKLGIGYADAASLRHDIVYVAVNGYGRSGPGALRPSTHPIPGGALGGVFYQLGGAPPRTLEPLAAMRETARRLMRANEVNPDPNTSMVVATAALLGLAARVRHGIGQEIHVDMFGANAYANFDDFIDFPGKPARALPDGELLGVPGAGRLHRCRDGWVFVAGDPSVSTLAPDVTVAECQVQLAARGIVCVPAVTSSLAAVLRDDPLARRCRLVGEAQSREWGTYTRHGRMVDFVGAQPLRGAPQLGEHSRALLEELGFGPADAMRLFTAQVVADAR